MPSVRKLPVIFISLLLVAVSVACIYFITSPNYSRTIAFSPDLSTEISEAAVTGGRAKGGTFAQPAPSRSLPRQDYYDEAPSRSYSSRPYSQPYSRPYSRTYPDFYYPQPPILVPFPTNPYPGYSPAPSYTTVPDDGDGFDLGFIFVMIILAIVVLPVMLSFFRSSSSTSDGSGNELTNDIVTVTELQIALVAQARELQRDLTQLTERADLSTQAGLSELLRETVLALLRSPEYWTHAKVRGQTLRSRTAAAQLFEQLSLEERSKFSLETLVNVSGQIRRQSSTSTSINDPAAYIVVTLLVGTADDRPLLSQVRSTAELKQALQRLGAISSDYLLIYELLWSPQDERDSLSREELIAQYPDLIQI